MKEKHQDDKQPDELMEIHYDEKRVNELEEKIAKTGMLTPEEFDELVSLGVRDDRLSPAEDGNFYTMEVLVKKFGLLP